MGLDHPMIHGRSTAAAHRSLRGSSAEDKFSVLRHVTLTGALTFDQLNPSTLRRPGRLQIISETLRTKNSNLGLCFCLSVSVGMQINRVYPFFVFNDQDRKFAINPHTCHVAR